MPMLSRISRLPLHRRTLATAAGSDLPFTRLFINGEHRVAADGRAYDVVNPGDKRVVGRGANAGAAECKAAVDAAAAAQPAWEKSSFAQRREILLRAADFIERSAGRIRDTLRAETGAAPAWADFQTHGCISTMRTAAAMTSELTGRTYPSALIPGGHVIEQRRALGVVFSISPWNAPNVLATRAIALPLLCGNAVVLKGSEYSPATINIVIEAFAEAGAPPGTLNYITTASQDSAARCAEIIAHPAVRKLTFTGSDVVGRALAAECARHLKPAVLELGGKSAALVLADADVAHAAHTIVQGAMANAGQVCMATERVVVERSVAPALRAAILAHLKELDGKKAVGPLFAERSAENTVKMLADAKAAGAQFAFGDGTRQGAFVRPHLVTDVPVDSTLWQRESFGPVISLVEAESVAHAIEIANDSDYTLTASLFTRNLHAALEVAGAIRAASVLVNGNTVHPEPTNAEIGLGGSSGYGRFDVDAFTDRRSIIIYPEQPQIPPMV